MSHQRVSPAVRKSSHLSCMSSVGKHDLGGLTLPSLGGLTLPTPGERTLSTPGGLTLPTPGGLTLPTPHDTISKDFVTPPENGVRHPS